MGFKGQNLSSKCSVRLQRAALQLKAQRQLQEAFETRLQRIQTNMQPNLQPLTQGTSYTAPSTDTITSSGQ